MIQLCCGSSAIELIRTVPQTEIAFCLWVLNVSGWCCPERMSSDVPSGCGSVKGQDRDDMNFVLILN